MAKIGLTKLITIKEPEVNITYVGEQALEVKQYLPLEKKIELVNHVANSSITETGINPIQRDVLADLAIVEYYTNIKFTEKQKEDMQKTYDLLSMNGIIEGVKKLIPSNELGQIMNWIWSCVNAIEAYGNSARGILKDITTNYDGTKLNVEEILKDIKDPAMAEFIKNLPNLV